MHHPEADTIPQRLAVRLALHLALLALVLGCALAWTAAALIVLALLP